MRTLLFCAAGALALSTAVITLAGEQSPAQSQSPPAASSHPAAPQQPKPATPAKKVWTNDDVDALREHRGGVSVVGGGSAAAPASGGAAANTPATPEKKPALPKEKDPDWYKKQLAPLYARRDALETQIANAESAVSGDTRGSATVSMSDMGSAATPQQQLAQLQQEQQQVQTQIDALEDAARHNDLEPGALR